MKIVGVRFANGYDSDYCSKLYYYKLDDSVKVKIGDYAVVEALGKIQLTQVHMVKPSYCAESSYATKDIIAIVNLDCYHKEQNRKKARAELIKRMDDRVKVVGQNYVYEIVAKTDPVMAAMLCQLKLLS